MSGALSTAASSLRSCRDCFAKDDDGKMAKKPTPKICEYFIDSSVLYVDDVNQMDYLVDSCKGKDGKLSVIVDVLLKQ